MPPYNFNGEDNRLYHYPVLSKYDLGLVRSPGAGLGNLLFPIARAVQGQHNLGGTMVYPTLRQLKFGTYFRNERDRRTYGDVFRSRSLLDWKQWVLSKTAKELTEDQEFKDLSRKSSVIRYEGLKNYFHDISDCHEAVSNWILQNANLKGVIEEPYDIGIHIRLGDFVNATTSASQHSIRQPFDWYRKAHDYAQQLGNFNAPRTILFTDENPDEVSEKLKLRNIELDPAVNAITSITNLSKAKYIITSRSTFSMWAVYLGQNIALWNSEFNFATSMPMRDGKDIVI